MVSQFNDVPELPRASTGMIKTISEGAKSVFSTVMLNVQAPDADWSSSSGRNSMRSSRSSTRGSSRSARKSSTAVPRISFAGYVHWTALADPVEEEEEEEQKQEEAEKGTQSVDSDRARIVMAWRRRLAYSEDEVRALVQTEHDFQDLKKALRKKNCVTNAYLKQNLHNYMYHLRIKRIQEFQNSQRSVGPLMQVSNSAA